MIENMMTSELDYYNKINLDGGETTFLFANPVSTFIKRISYLEQGKGETMFVYFNDGDIIKYKSDVPAYYLRSVYDSFVSAESVGKYWHRHIKNVLEGKRL